MRASLITPLLKNKTGLSPFSDQYSTDFSPRHYLYIKHGYVASIVDCGKMSCSFLSFLIIDCRAKRISCKTSFSENAPFITQDYYYLPKIKGILSVREYSSNREHILFHNEDRVSMDFIEDIRKYHVPYLPEREENKVSLIVSDVSGLRTEQYKINIGEINVPLFYGNHFLPVYEKILTSLKKENGNGLVLLHGEPGAGKTSIIKYIAKQLTKDVIFIPPNMGDSLCSPQIIPFLLRHKNSVLIIEDAERIISDRNNKMFSEGVSSILNITDGILGDCLNIQIICTFNTERDKIDQALLRKGRLIAEHKFTKLGVAESNDLLSHLGFSQKTTRPLSLAEIFNSSECEFVSEKKEAVGFKLSA